MGAVVALLLSLVKKHCVPQMDGASIQHGGLTSSVRRAQQQSGGRIQARTQLWMMLIGMAIIEVIENFHLLELQYF